MQFVIITILGCFLGRIGAGWSAVMLADMNSGGLLNCPRCGSTVSHRQRWFDCRPIRCGCKARPVKWHIGATFGLGGLFLAFSWLVLEANCQAVHEVRPDLPLLYLRLPYQLTLIFFLWVATLTDLLDYVIPDEVIYSGIVIALVASVTSGDLQMMHLWVNWDDAVAGLRGPSIPEWIRGFHRLHGLAWSMAGLLTGGSLTWLVRRVSHWILGYPALGLGDVTLMAMVGAFVGWQATLCALAISPLAGILIGILVRLLTGRSFVAYGPYLALSAVLVMGAWRWLWADFFTLRDIFSHGPSVIGLIAFSFVVLCVLLFLLRLFRTLPTEGLRR
ncbi:MAG: A24 family peptidase [Fuerstiella sp.]|jgi:leader peptidase (prepilin peptidase)/N-methyltransferase|nr:A24 family peptidase [Fuerstiella sp.]